MQPMALPGRFWQLAVYERLPALSFGEREQESNDETDSTIGSEE
jgi:hypothetical protein